MAKGYEERGVQRRVSKAVEELNSEDSKSFSQQEEVLPSAQKVILLNNYHFSKIIYWIINIEGAVLTS